MAGHFSEIHNGRCAYYARFMRKGSRNADEAVLWVLFVFVILLLSISSRSFTKSEFLARSIADEESRAGTSLFTLDGTAAERARQRRAQIRCVLVTCACTVVGLAALVLEALAILAIQFCHGEDLIQLYWAFWTLIQVGSLIAILGINFSQLYGLFDNTRGPPWSVALGTPVLVLAAVAHMVHDSVARKWRARVEEKRTAAASLRSGKTGPSMHHTMSHISRASTLGPTSAMLIGSTTDNAPLYLVPTTTQSDQLPEGARVVGSVRGGWLVQSPSLSAAAAAVGGTGASNSPTHTGPRGSLDAFASSASSPRMSMGMGMGMTLGAAAGPQSMPTTPKPAVVEAGVEKSEGRDV